MVNAAQPRYDRRDRELIAYPMSPLGPRGFEFRGPIPDLTSGNYFTCVGAAQTFGCLVEDPFPALLSRDLGLPVLNLGMGGAGPLFFLDNPDLLALANRGRFTIVQVMSGRSEDNRHFESHGLATLTERETGRRLSADDAWRKLIAGRAPSRVPWLSERRANQVGRALALGRVARAVRETRRNYLEHFMSLFDALTGPTILLWFAQRPPEYRTTYRGLNGVLGSFPHLVDRRMVDRLRQRPDEYVEVVSSRGIPQPLVSRHTGEPVELDLGLDSAVHEGGRWRVNTYYPSPEMHEDAAHLLRPAASRMSRLQASQAGRAAADG